MGIFFWKNNEAIDAFATTLANDFYNAITPQNFDKFLADNLDKKKNKKYDKNIKRAIGNVVTRIKDFKFQKKLGVYGKARLHLKFKNRLYELGYSESVVEDVNKLIMVETP